MVSETVFFSLGWGETESDWYIVHYLAYCTIRERWIMVNVEQPVE
jgi:hypothetical protein